MIQRSMKSRLGDNMSKLLIIVTAALFSQPLLAADPLVCRDEKYTEVLSLSGLPPGLKDARGGELNKNLMADHGEEFSFKGKTKKIRFDVAAMSEDCLFVALEYTEHGFMKRGYLVQYELFMRDGHEWSLQYEFFGGKFVPKSFEDFMGASQLSISYWYYDKQNKVPSRIK